MIFVKHWGLTVTDKLDIQQVYTDLAYSEQVAHVGPRLLAAIPLLLDELHRLQKQRQTVIDLCAMNMAVDDGSSSDVDTIWPSQVTNLLDISDAEITASSRLAFRDDD